MRLQYDLKSWRAVIFTKPVQHIVSMVAAEDENSESVMITFPYSPARHQHRHQWKNQLWFVPPAAAGPISR